MKMNFKSKTSSQGWASESAQSAARRLEAASLGLLPVEKERLIFGSKPLLRSARKR
jgi:hypothetical protein